MKKVILKKEVREKLGEKIYENRTISLLLLVTNKIYKIS